MGSILGRGAAGAQLTSVRLGQMSTGGVNTALQEGREHYARRAWDDAYRALLAADQAAGLPAEDLQRLAWAAGLTGRDQEMVRLHERLHQLHLDAGDCLAAARVGVWLTLRLFSLGEPARASGWLGKSQRLVEREGRDCVERGYLLLPTIMRLTVAGEHVAALDGAVAASEIAERFDDRDLLTFARGMQARNLLRLGQCERGLALLDEVMVETTTGPLSPMVIGLVYCGGISACSEAFALDRAREWTVALDEWCRSQPQLVSFTGHCLVHRSEIKQMGGAWPEAIAEAERATERAHLLHDVLGAASACYQAGEIHRLRGDFAAAEAAYRRASEQGMEPQPGLALLRLGQGDREAAAGAIRRVVAATTDPLRRARFLPAHVEIMLAAGDLEEARRGAGELGTLAAKFQSEVLGAIAAHADAAVRLAEGDAAGALEPARRAFALWQRLDAPYLAARLRALLGRACQALGDADGASLEREAARQVFQRLGAAGDLAALDDRHTTSHGLTARELQVLRLVASGQTNKEIAAGLSLSEKTVDRHVSNIFAKIDVSTRAAATAFAYEHRLVAG
jgi:DNA-binding NarL/FixJ family response regulator